MSKPIKGNCDGKVVKGDDCSEFAFSAEKSNEYSALHVAAFCAFSGFAFVGQSFLMFGLGSGSTALLKAFLVAFVCCCLSAVFAEKLRLTSFRVFGKFFMLLLFCLFLVGHFAVIADNLIVEFACILAMMTTVALVEGIIGYLLNDRYSINYSSGLIRAICSTGLFTLQMYLTAVNPEILKLVSDSLLLFFCHMTICVKLRSVTACKAISDKSEPGNLALEEENSKTCRPESCSSH